MKKNKILSLLLSFAIITGTLPALAENIENTDEIIENISDNSDIENISDSGDIKSVISADFASSELNEENEGDEENKPSVPASITITNNAKNIINGTVIAAKGDKFTLSAYDENGNETPVKWSNKSSGKTVSINENTGKVEILEDLYATGTSYLYFTATSTLDESISQKTTVKLSGYVFSKNNKNQTITLSEDGQTQKTATVTGGQNGYNIWSCTVPEGVAELAQDPKNGNSVKFNLFRPGVIGAVFKLSIDENLTDSATVTINGVAVEDTDGNRTKTYIDADSENPTVSLIAFTQEGRTVASWSSADESIATVDENGVVTARGIGSTIITATDSDNAKGGIKVVCRSSEKPYFENLQFLSNAISNYNTVYKFSPTVTEYSFNLSQYSTTKLTLQNTTLFDSSVCAAYAKYTNIDNTEKNVEIESGKITYLDGLSFGETAIEITIYDKSNPSNKTVYTINVTRPRDSNKQMRAAVLVPDGRNLYSSKYNGFAEGTMFKLNADGSIKTGWGTNPDTGFSSTHYSYKCFMLENPENFSLKLTGNTIYTHLRYSYDGEEWNELPQGGGTTDKIAFKENTAEVRVQIIDDKTYFEKVNDDKDGFSDSTPTEYKIIVEKANASTDSVQMQTAETAEGDWYPCEFKKDIYSYTVVMPQSVTSEKLNYTIPDGASVKVGNDVQTAVDGIYTLDITTSQKTVSVISADGNLINEYKFKLQKKSEGYPDKVTDFLCINSQYTNGIGAGNGASPWVSLSGSFASTGNFGGYITYYYETPLTDNPNNKYGIDFYVYGNANKDTSTSTKTSFFEPAQAWVSEDGENWYALAGSAHYDDGVKWDYSVTYKKTADGKTAWADNSGNSNDGSSYCGMYPNASLYPTNKLASADEIKLSGIALPARNGKIAVSGETTDAYPIKWGYADCFANGTKGKDVNPYTDNTNFDLNANGFDLKWAVDEHGIPVDVSDKEFHYVKLVTASNIWHTSFGEKSPEIAGVMRTKAQTEAVGTTNAPSGVTISDKVDSKVINFSENTNVYSVNVGDMKYVSVAVNGADENDNIYVNNTRIAYNEAADGFKITKDGGEKLVRILVQNGDKEPLIYILKLTGTAESSDELIEGIKINVNGTGRIASSNDGINYTSSVGYRISSVNLVPVADSDVTVKINGESVKDSYALVSGENTFTVTGEKDGIQHSVTLLITKDYAPASMGRATVYFTLMGDSAHGEDGKAHTLKNGGLETWMKKCAVEIDLPATVLDVFEKALDGKHTFINADGNYISEIDGLAEFTNGTLSGWMYTLNGKHTDKGVAEQSVKNGDSIVFHYTDDYTAEQYTEQWQGNSSHSSSGKIDNSENKSENNAENPNSSNSAGEFADMKTHWAKEAVEYVYDKALMNGVDSENFAPDANMTRAMLVTVLFRFENAENTDRKITYTDIPDGAWYANAVAWAAESGIVNGINADEFAPESDITREQLCTIIYRYAKMHGYASNFSADLSAFADAGEISPWAYEAFEWALHRGIINGTSESTLSPKKTATRAEVAAIIMRFCEMISK